ncbi:hypothetical protein BN439_3883 [Erwinia amylovora Ea644]|nr:hypothetical protein BN439_3883 [Erwinia amylovora Ea644]CCP08986.1 hypothetical protein BN440_4002 [Erwinia amylovora MR1]
MKIVRVKRSRILTPLLMLAHPAAYGSISYPHYDDPSPCVSGLANM